jgi:hypothetical protein
VEDLFDLSSPSELGWKKFDLPFAIHFQTQPSVFEKIPGLKFKMKNETQFMDPAFRFDGVQKNRVEYWNILFPGFDPGVKGEASQGIHDLGDIDVVWASNATGIAGGTDPDGFRREDPFAMVILNMTKDLIWENIHRICHRTSG